MASIIQQLQDFFDKEEFSLTYLPPTDEIPVERLLLLLGFDRKTRELKLEITEISRVQEIQNFLPSDLHIPSRLQFKVDLPFKVKDLAINEVSAFIHFINQTTDLPGFEFNELEGQAMYRYIWITSPDHLEKQLVTSIVDSIRFNLVMFSDMIESLSDGTSTFNDLLSQILKNLGSAG